MKVKKHYDEHLGNFYSWMIGDTAPKIAEFKEFLSRNNIIPKATSVAIDLGAGNGIQSLALKQMGFSVTAIDFNEQLISELKKNPNAEGIDIVQVDFRKEIASFKDSKPEVILCCGDTITHLESIEEIDLLIKQAASILSKKGYLILSFRDYSTELNDTQRFIPVKSTSNRILTCILEYTKTKIKVTDLLHEKDGDSWIQKVSSYEKIRISVQELESMLKVAGLDIPFSESEKGMHSIIATKV